MKNNLKPAYRVVINDSSGSTRTLSAHATLETAEKDASDVRDRMMRAAAAGGVADWTNQAVKTLRVTAVSP